MESLHLLFATSEVFPLIKTGGLADVSGALPAALARLGVEATLLLPGYATVLDSAGSLQQIARLDLPQHGEVRLLQGRLPDGLPLLLIDHAGYYQRAGNPYLGADGHDWPDNALRFGLLSQMAAWLAGEQSPLPRRPDVLHCNDWQTGLAPAYLRFYDRAHAATVMTIHNLAYQGVFPPTGLGALNLPQESFHLEGLEFHGMLSFLKAGLVYSDRITTVSPSYAREIQQEPLGFGLQGLLHHRREVLTGILNGIDTEEWNPATDARLWATYDAGNLSGKARCKAALQQEMSLALEADTPLLAVVSRIAPQKGLDVVADALPQLMQMGFQFVLLGSGERALETRFRNLAETYPGRVAVRIGYDETLSHRIEAGADVFLMPSRFEPCGLNQMYSQRYGTLPVVAPTGGLLDTVTDATAARLASGEATGFVLERLDAAALRSTLARVNELYRNKEAWLRMQRAAMGRDFGWAARAEEYLALYRNLLARQ